MGQSIQDKLQAAVQAQEAGVPVDWQALCVETYNVATAEIQGLQEALQKQKAEEVPTPQDTGMTPAPTMG